MTSFDLLAEAERDGFRSIITSAGKVQGQYNGACILPAPGCNGIGHDRLRIQPNVGQYGRFVCSICGTSGSGVDWLMLMRGMSKNEALKYVDWKPKDGSTPYLTQARNIPLHSSLADRSEIWRINAFNLARAAYVAMTDETRVYLNRRQITEEMISDYTYGLYNQYKKVKRRSWGDDSDGKMRIPRGIVIPWINGQQEVRCVRLRRLPWDESDEAKEYYGVGKDGKIGRYRALSGVDSTHFYQGHKITPGCKVALFEGEFTSVVAQAASKDSVCVATGSTSWCCNDANVRLLATCEQVLICFDADENGAGDKASAWWVDRLANAVRWRPLWGDANDMAMDGIDIGGWLDLGFEQQEDTPVALAADYSEEIVFPDWFQAEVAQTVQPCCTCLSLDPPRETPAIRDYEGLMYCAEHMPTARVLTQGEMIERIAAALPGWTVTVEPRTTLAAYQRSQYQDRDRGKWITDPSRPRVPDEVWCSIPLGNIWQKITEEGSKAMQGDYWAETHAKLKQTGYYEQVARDEADFWQRVEVSRTYPGPVPRYELVEVDGSKTVVQVGYWPEQIEQGAS